MTEDSKGKKKPPRQAYNIQFAHGLSGESLLDIIQLELLRARSSDPPQPEASLPTPILHEIKFRLKYYLEKHGEVERPTPKKVGTRD